MAILALALLAAAARAAEPASQADVLFNQARFDLMNGHYQQALDKLDQARRLAPEDKRLTVWKVKVLRALGREKEALALSESLLEQNPRLYGPLHFEAAQILFGQGQAERALGHLRDAESVERVDALLAQMDLLLQAGEYEASATVPKRAGDLKPRERQDLLLKQALAYYRNYEYDKALHSLAEAKAAAPNSEAIKAINALEKEIKLVDRPWWFGASVSYIYDSNVFLDPLYQDPAHAAASGRSDTAALADVWFGARLARWNGLSLGFTGQVQYMNYFKETEASYSFWAPGVYLAWGKYRWGFRLPYSFYYYYHTGRMTDWSQIHSFTPMVYWQMTAKLKTYFTAVLLRRTYHDDRSAAYHYGLVIDHVYTLSVPTSYLKLSYRYDVEDADDGISGYAGYEITLAGGRRIWGPVSAEAGLTWARYNYDRRQEWTLNYQEFDRQDDQMRYYLELKWSLPQWWNLKLSSYYINNDSNVQGSVSPYDYHKYVLMFTVTKYF
ncbi:MAG: tetratricopeptide repeat protein [Thermodesulfobacteriota bacterium]